MKMTKQMKVDLREAYPEVQCIVLSQEIMHEEIARNLDKQDCDYKIIDNEQQLIIDEIGKRTVTKIVLWSTKKQKFKVLVFL